MCCVNIHLLKCRLVQIAIRIASFTNKIAVTSARKIARVNWPVFMKILKHSCIKISRKNNCSNNKKLLPRIHISNFVGWRMSPGPSLITPNMNMLPTATTGHTYTCKVRRPSYTPNTISQFTKYVYMQESCSRIWL